MTGHTLPDDDDVAFARQLLGAGRAEMLTGEQTRAAVARFGAAIAALQAVRAASPRGDSVPGAGNWSRRLCAAKWLAVGAIGGGLLTFAWLEGSASAPAKAPAPVIAGVVAPPPAALATAPSAEAKRTLPAATNPPPPAESLRSAPRARPKPASDLAAEVRALDGIRTALSIGASNDAERQLAAYRASFPRGALRSEAKVLSLELLVAQGRKRAAALAAERFIAEHPREPQIARVRAFVETEERVSEGYTR